MKAKLVRESLNEEVQSRGKTQKILDFIKAAGPEGARYTDIVKFAYELSYGEGTYSHEHRGYWSGGFKTPTPDDRGFGHLMKYLTKNEKGRWILRDEKMTPDEAEFHGSRVSYGDSEYKPKLYDPKMKWKRGQQREQQKKKYDEENKMLYKEYMDRYNASHPDDEDGVNTD